MCLTYPQRYYLAHFLYILSISFTKTTLYLYLSDCHRIPQKDVHFIFGLFTISVMLFEVPTSSLGEYIGPRKSFLIGIFLKFFSSAIFLFGKIFWQFCIAEIISALAVSFISGSLNAWLMDWLNKNPDAKKEDTPHIFILDKRISTVGLALGGLLGAFCGGYHLGLPWLMVTVGMMITFVVSLSLLTEHENYQSWKKKEKVYRKWDWETTLHGYRLCLNREILLVLIFNAFLVSFALASPKIVWLPFLKSYFNKDMLFLGYMWLGIMAIQFLGTFGIDYLLNLAGSALRLLLFFTIFTVMMLAGLIFFKHVNGVLGFILLYFLLEWAKPYHRALILALIYQESPSHKGRLTILSIESLLDNFGNSMGLLITASLGDFQTITFAWSVGAGLYALIIPCMIYLVLKESHAKQSVSLAV